MDLKIIEVNKQKIADLYSDEVIINDTQDALDLMADAGYYGAQSIILHERNLNPAFFDLRTRFAGDILLKFTGYRVKLAVVGDFEKYPSTSLQAFIRESNRGNQVSFVPNRKTAIIKLTR